MEWKVYPDQVPEQESRELQYLGCRDNSHVVVVKYYDGSFHREWGGWFPIECHYWMDLPTPPPIGTKKDISFTHYIYATPGLEQKLRSIGIVTLDDLLNTRKETILNIKGIGMKAFEKLRWDLVYSKIQVPEWWK